MTITYITSFEEQGEILHLYRKISGSKLYSFTTYKTFPTFGFLFPPDGYYHRLDRPAFRNDDNNFASWWKYGLRHREDGPAYCDFYNHIFKWYLNGEEYSKADFLAVQKDNTIKINGKIHLIDGRPIRGL